MSDSANTKYIIRVEGTAGRFGLGEVISENVHLFKAGHYNLTAEELQAAIARTGKRGAK